MDRNSHIRSAQVSRGSFQRFVKISVDLEVRRSRIEPVQNFDRSSSHVRRGSEVIESRVW